jgi:RNA polymerase sigma-70 factor (ECF subfamily)
VVDQTNKSRFAVRIRNCAKELRQGVDALGPLYDLTAPRALRYAQMLTRNRQDAEDALQAALVRIALKPHRLADARHPWAYFLKIVRNEAIGISRRKQPELLVTSVLETWPAVPPAEDAAELRRRIRRAVQNLPPTQSEVVVLKIWEGMTFAEIADVLEQSANTVASRYRYALRKLTQHLQALCDEVRHG